MLCRNHDVALTYMFACSRLGLTPVPLNTRWAGPDVARGLKDCGAYVIVCDYDLLGLLSRARAAGADVQRVIVVFSDLRGGPLPADVEGVEVVKHDDLVAGDWKGGATCEGEEGRGDDIQCLV